MENFPPLAAVKIDDFSSERASRKLHKIYHFAQAQIEEKI